MIAEKPSWVRHEGMQIFSIDVQPGGLRFATGGGDHKVRIWNMKSVGRDLENDESTQRLLATLRDHFGSVNCVRWAKHGRFVASGSDDQVILVHERKPGSGTTEFGSGEPPDVENWKVAMTLRGHTADVVDLNWSPDDSILASGSLDNTIHIWNMSNGICTAVLRGHSSLVKGVTWDPIGSFIASQSDDKTVIIWRTSDWSLAHRTEGHWAKSLGSTFFRRLGWSPCGHFITTTHGFQKPRHSAPVLERGEWAATFDFLGHNAPVIVVKFNHSMFRRNFANSQDAKAPPVGWANGAAKIGGKESQPYNVIAIGSQDRTITVWTTASPRPLFVAKHFFSQSVVDLSWSPDGYSLFACSLDGTVATFHFEVKELGHRLSDDELDELKRSRYGDVRGRQANLAESPAQLLLEAASAKQTTSKKAALDVQQNQIPAKPLVELGVTNKNSEPQNDDGKKNGAAASDGLNKVASSARISSPVKQREYRRPDGRKRIIPEAVGVPSQQENISGSAQSQPLDFPVASSDHRKNDNGVVPIDGVREASVRGTIGRSSDLKERSGVTARATVTESLVIEKVPVAAGQEHSINVEQSGSMKPSGSTASSTTSLSIRVFDKKEGEGATPVCLEARPRERAVNDIVGVGNACVMKETEIVCTRGAQTLWSDRISGKVSVLAGNANFWAVGCEDGCLQTGELAALQVDVRKYLARKPGWSRVTDDGVQTRAHLEAQLASSLALKSPNEYRQSLLSYIRFLAREADESRLREVCESFYGPPTGMASDSKNPAWDPYVLGMRKHKLLREDILPAMASNRKVQRLLNEFMDLLSEYESVENNIDQRNPSPPPTTTQPAIDLMDSTPSETGQTDSAVPMTDKTENPSLGTNQMDSAPSSITDQVNTGTRAADQINEAPTTKDAGS
ncbi:hypothetical protein COLO4_19917 [Corchorus olitorius]|uniref:Protein HIRA n=1 Tax=Corchorus olitorius TaxID=93759 RepID=A0A1R3J2T8_9ROSI|nr:hypothetical protein COLO4_19917 [Corchorus olitorius]